MSAVLLDENIGPQVVTLLGDDYTGACRLVLNHGAGGEVALPRGNVAELVRRLQLFLDSTVACPRCGHSRLDHFALWTKDGKLYGCSHGTGGSWALAGGLPCDCPGVPQ